MADGHKNVFFTTSTSQGYNHLQDLTMNLLLIVSLKMFGF